MRGFCARGRDELLFGSISERQVARISFLKCALAALSLCLWSCDGQKAKGTPNANDDSGETEESPNARILPEPLEAGEVAKEEDSEPSNIDGVDPAVPKKREKPRPFPVSSSVDDDTLRRGVGTGFEMEFQVSWPDIKKLVRVGDSDVTTWPTFQVQLLREQLDEPARLRMVLQSVVFPLPMGTELRARADRVGHLILWPDQRSYRIAPPGSLHVVLADRRVDRVPYVVPSAVVDGEGTRLGKDTRSKKMTTPVGEVLLELVEVKELVTEGPLLCSSLLELVRLRATAAICPDGHLPVHLEVTWPDGKKFALAVNSWGAVPDLALDHFRAPPDLPIFKRGELPPSSEYFLDEKARLSLLPITRDKGDPLPLPPVAAPPTAPFDSPAAVATTPTSAPRNELVLENATTRPLVVAMNRMPLLWLEPGKSVPVYLEVGEVRLLARSFFGDVSFDEAPHSAPRRVTFGAPPPLPQTPPPSP